MIHNRPAAFPTPPTGRPGLLPRAPLRPSLAVLAGAVLLAGTALAQDGPSPAEGTARAVPAPPATPPGPRYSFTPVEGGALKLDTQTGMVSLCAKRAAGFTCEAVPDSRDAYEAEITRLQKEVDRLKGATPPDAGTGTALPGTDEIDQALDYMERIFRRFRGMVERLNEPPVQPQEKL